MLCLRRSSILLTLSAATALLFVGCGNSKVAQCNEIIKIANQAVSEAKQLTNGGQTDDPQAMIEAADAMERAAQTMKQLDLSDSELQNYRSGFIEMYAETATATRDFVEAYKKKNRPGAESALSNLQQATKPEPELIQGINTYCKEN